jgi:hypothetical protein
MEWESVALALFPWRNFGVFYVALGYFIEYLSVDIITINIYTGNIFSN